VGVASNQPFDVLRNLHQNQHFFAERKRNCLVEPIKFSHIDSSSWNGYFIIIGLQNMNAIKVESDSDKKKVFTKWKSFAYEQQYVWPAVKCKPKVNNDSVLRLVAWEVIFSLFHSGPDWGYLSFWGCVIILFHKGVNCMMYNRKPLLL